MTQALPAPAAPLSPAALGVDWAYHNPGLDPFPWQVALGDARVVLLSADLKQSVVLPSGGDIREPAEPHELPPALVPGPVLTAVRDALVRAGADELTELLHRRRQIAHVWGVDDMIAVRPDLSDDQAWAVLREVEATLDAEVGVTWRVLQVTADELFGPAPDDA